jgi:uncharacterized protein (TIGR03067 family)
MRRHLMIVSAAVVLFAGVGWLRAADSRADAIMKERKRLAGSWQAVAYVQDGKKAPANEVRKLTLVISADGKLAVEREGKTFMAGATQLDPAAKPAAIDISHLAGEVDGRASLGIYNLEGDTLTICRAAPGKNRPAKFTSRAGSGHTLLACKRILVK